MADDISSSFDALMGAHTLQSIPNFFSDELFQKIASCFGTSETPQDAIREYGYQDAADCLPQILKDQRFRCIVDDFFVVKWALADIELLGSRQDDLAPLALAYPYNSLSSEDLETNMAWRFMRVPFDLNIVVSLGANSPFVLEYARSEVLNPQVSPASDIVRDLSLPTNSACLWSGPVWSRSNGQGRALKIKIVPAFINKPTNLVDRLPIEFLRSCDAEFRGRLGIGANYPKKQPQPQENLT